MPLLTGTKPDYTTQDSSTYKANIDAAIDEIGDSASSIEASISPIFHAPFRSSLGFDGAGSLLFQRGQDISTYTHFQDMYGNLKLAGADYPRFETDGLLIEGPGENKILRSEDLAHADWTKVNTTITADDIDSPLGATGVNPADKIVETAVTNSFAVESSSTAAAGSVVGSIFLKADERDFAMLRLYNVTDGIISQVAVDLTDGSIVSGTGVVVTFNDGWYRCSLIGTATVVNTELHVLLSPDGTTFSYLGILTYGIHSWGGQVENESFVTSYIGPITTTARAREADVLILDYDYNFPIPNAFSIAAEISRSVQHPTDDQYIFDINNVVCSIRYRTALNTLRVSYDSVSRDSTGWAIGSKERFAVTMDGVNIRTYRDGIQVQDDAQSPITTKGLEIHLGWSGSVNSYLFGHLKNVKIFDIGLNSAQVATL